jgi:hypothetical protein
MSTERVKAILQQIADFSPTELTELYKHVAALRGTGLVQKTDEVVQVTSADEEFVLMAITNQLTRMGVEYTTLDQLRRYSKYKAFREKVPGLMQYIRGACPGRDDQRTLLELGVRLLYENQVKLGLMASARMVMDHLHRIVPILNASFPGYAAGGVLHLVPRR